MTLAYRPTSGLINTVLAYFTRNRIFTACTPAVPWTYIHCVSKKNIPDIFDCNLKTNYQILIILVLIGLFLTQLAIK